MHDYLDMKFFDANGDLHMIVTGRYDVLSCLAFLYGADKTWIRL